MEITFFKNQNLQYSNFSRQWIYEEFDKDPEWEETVFVKLSKNGDLLHHSYLVIKLNNSQIDLSNDKHTLYSLYNEVSINSFLENPQNNVMMVQYINTLLEIKNNNALNNWLLKYATIINNLDMQEYITKVTSLNTVYSNNNNVYSEDDIVSYDYNYETIKSIENNINISTISDQQKHQITDIIDISESIELYIFWIMMDYITILSRIENNKNKSTLKAKKDIITDTAILNEHIANKFFNFKLDVEFVDDIVYHLIDNIELKINDSTIDNYSGDFMRLMDKRLNKEYVYTEKDDENNIIINYPLHFWFNIYSSDALPISAMRYSNIEISILFNKLTNIIKNKDIVSQVNASTLQNAIYIKSMELLNEYMYLMPFERKKFMTTVNNYLIHQHQHYSEIIKAVDSSINYYLVRPCTHIFWAVKNIQNNTWCALRSIELGFSGDEIFQNTEPFYYNTVQPTQHGYLELPTNMYMYSFSLHPNNLQQPSGSINMTVIPNKFMRIVIDDVCMHNLSHAECTTCASLDDLIKGHMLEFHLWAINRNVFSVHNGYGTLDY